MHNWHVRTAGLFCAAAVALAPTLGAALRAFQRCFGAMQSASDVGFEVEDDRASFRYRILDNDIWPRRADSADSPTDSGNARCRTGTP